MRPRRTVMFIRLIEAGRSAFARRGEPSRETQFQPRHHARPPGNPERWNPLPYSSQ